MTARSSAIRRGARPYRRYSLFARVWGRHPDELALVVSDPVGEGIVSAPHLPTEATRDEPSAQNTPDTGNPSATDTPSPKDAAAASSRIAPELVVLRPALGRDLAAVDKVRMSDRAWLAPWEPTTPPQADSDPPTLAAHIRRVDRMARRGEALSMVIEVDGQPVGLVSAHQVYRGAMYSCSLGYWVCSRVAGLGLGSWAVAATIDLLLGELGMHRVEVNIRPENKPSLALARKLGLREEGYKPRFIHINGRWADHFQFSIDSESLPEYGLVESLLGRSDEF